MQQLFVHIGTHKTGTTSLQAYLMDHRRQLRRDGVAVCTEKHRKFGEIANCFALAHSVLRPGLMTVSRLTGDARKPGFWGDAKAFAHMAKLLSDKRAAGFVLSAEAFCFARTESEFAKIKRLLCSWGMEVRPIVCFRDAQTWRDSWFAQISKYQRQFQNAFGDGLDDIREDWYFDTQEILRFWNRIGPVSVVDYDEAVARDGTVIPALLGAMEMREYAGSEGYFLNPSQ